MGRVRFANQLRGLAALSVACSHLIGIYWYLPDVVSSVSASPPQIGPLPAITWLASRNWFSLGPFGVGIFFLISGMVVPFSLDRHGRGGFIIARLLRIFPTYAVALVIETAAVYASAYGWGRAPPFGLTLLAGNVSLIYDLIGQPSIDLVNWTLSVELKFYLLIVVLAWFVRRASAMAVIATAALLCAANGAIAAGWIGSIDASSSTISYTFSSHSLCLIFMLIGTLFNFHLRGKLSTTALVASVAILSALFVETWQLGVWRAQFPAVTINYGYALLLFGVLYAVRRHIPRNPILDGMAAISFPFYLLHSLVGYVLLRAGMLGLRLPYYASLSLALLIIIGVSVALHFLVERPTQALGRALRPREHRPRVTPTIQQQKSHASHVLVFDDAASRRDRST